MYISSSTVSLVSSDVNILSKMETYFPTISPTPEASSSRGAEEYTSSSANSAIGGADGNVTFLPCHVIAATPEAKPSTLAAVGKETNGIFLSCAE